MNSRRLVVDLAEGESQRLDTWIADKGILSRSQMRIRNLQAACNGNVVKLSKKITAGDVLDLQWNDEESLDLKPENISLEIIYEDSNVIVLCKPQGMVVHPANGHYSGTLVHGLLYHLKNEEFQKHFSDNPHRPGIVHRLDKDTSGVMIVAKNSIAHAFLAEQFKAKTVKKQYWAVIKGRLPKRQGTVETFITRDPVHRKRFTVHDTQGKWAVTHWKTEEDWGEYRLIKVDLETGRTHQIRVHMNSLGAPVLGDPIYSRKDNRYPGYSLMLHAGSLTILLPGESTPRTFEAPLPERFNQFKMEITTAG